MGHHTQHQLGSWLSDKGVDFCVWAPFAASVNVMVGEPYAWVETPLENSDGTWCGFVEGAKAGQSYKYKIITQTGEALEKNDPRARQLTVSDDGASVIIDHSYDWEETVRPSIPKEEQIIYELHIGTFHRPDPATPGTFATAIEKLDYLVSLGITTIELMPVTSIATSNGWGYAPNYLFSVESSYGGRHGLLEFVKECHKRGLAVMLDVVYNHFSAKTDLWQYDGWSENDKGGIYFYNDERVETPWGGRPDYGRPEVRQFLLDNVAMWFTEYNIDGLRVDSTIYMRNTKGSEGGQDTEIADAWSLLQDMTTLARNIYPKALLVAEDSSGNEAITKPIDQGGAGFDAQWGLAFPHTVRAALGLEEPGYGNTLVDELSHSYDSDGFAKIIFSDSHDTAANGSVRLNEAASPGNAGSATARQDSLIASAITLTAPGIPLLLQGVEFLQEGNFNDWQMLDWQRTKQFSGIVLAHQHLINLRKNMYGNTAGLTGDNINVFHEDISTNVLGYHRWKDGGVRDDVIVIINFSDQTARSYELYFPVAGTWHVRFNSSWKGYSVDFNEIYIANVTTDGSSRAAVDLPAKAIIILAQDPDATEAV